MKYSPMLARLEIGVVGLLHDPRHVPGSVSQDDTEALIILDFLGPDDPVGIRAVDHRQIGIEDSCRRR